MSIWKNFLEKKSAEAKMRGFNKMTSLFDSTTAGSSEDDGFYKMYFKLIGVIILGFFFMTIVEGALK